jgi:hypothetical protein
MSLSSISPITLEGLPQDLSSFLRSGVMYVLWHSPINDTGLKRIHWKPHTGLDFTDVIPALNFNFKNVTALYHPGSDQLVIVWDDGQNETRVRNGSIYIARFNVLTGALLAGPTIIFQGSNPKLSYKTTAGDDMTLYFLTAKSEGIYGSLSFDGGLTWDSAEPIITNQVVMTKNFEVIPYDASHVAIAQLGADPRRMMEIGMLQRTRPLSCIVKHPTLANSFFVGEPSKFDNTTLTDHQRGGLVLATNNTKLYHLDGVQQGSSDSVGAVALVTVTGAAPAVSASAGPTGNGDDVNEYSLVPAAGSLNVDLPGASFAVSLDVSSTHAYVAEYADNSAVLGQFIVVDLSSGTTSTPLSGIAAVRAVGVANFLATPLIFVATTESSVERLRVYQQNALTPTLLLNTKLPARVNSINVLVHPSSLTGARLLVSMVDRFNIYEYTGAAAPVTLVDSFFFAGGGQFFKSVVSTGGSIVTAAGDAGVVVLDYNGKIKSQVRVSGRVISAWSQSTAYTAGQMVVPRARHQFARNRFYFTCSSSGTSGSSEPAWALTGTMTDGSAQWTPTAVVDGVVSDVAIDESTKRIYAVGTTGGALGTNGRLWVLDARGLL